ncbi:MAG: hypothetical protein SGBAC_012314, partial [Bacillariaceae sp.]
PTTAMDNDEASLAATDLFDQPESSLTTSKPFLEAAIKARKQADKMERIEQAKRNKTLGEHLDGMNQPATIIEEDEKSLESMDVFDPPKSAFATSRPLLAAAIKAREQADKLERAQQEKRNVTLGEHLDGMNQPATIIEEDEESLESMDVFDPPKSALAKSKPLLAAAIKAREQADQLELQEQTKQSEIHKDQQSNQERMQPSGKWSIEETVYGFHLRDMNQPAAILEEDSDSLGSMDLFDAPKSALAKSKPLLAAAIKAREQADQLEQEEQAKQRKTLEDQQSNKPSGKWSIEETVYGFHLRDMNQPTGSVEEDSESLGSTDLFDPPKSELATSKPLLAAAIKAREQADQLEQEEQTRRSLTLGEHLVGMNQPTTIAEEDENSLGSTDLFDPPKSAVAMSKPLLAAAIKAREQADELERVVATKPATITEEDEESVSVSDSASFPSSSSSSSSNSSSSVSSDKSAPTSAAGGAAEKLADLFEVAELSPSIDDTELLPFIQLDVGIAPQAPYGKDADSSSESTDDSRLKNDASGNQESGEQMTHRVMLGEHLDGMNQPSATMEEDEESLGSTDLFDPPKSAFATSRPLLAAAIKAREQADQLEQEERAHRHSTLGEHLDGLNQPTTIVEDDENSLGSTDLFDPPKSALAKSKPLLAAAIKAREQAYQLEPREETKRSSTVGEHLVGLNQPIAVAEEDEDSLGSMDLFDPPKNALAKSKPLLAAAMKAREQLDHQLGDIQIQLVTINEEKSSHSFEKLIDPMEEEGEDARETLLAENTNRNSGLNSAEYPSTVDTVPDVRSDDLNSLDDSSLSTGELDELEYLFQVMEDGGEYDQKRLYDLDLIAKSRAGVDLDKDEKTDLVIVMHNRRKERAYRNEFQFLLEEKENGKKVDENRLLFLELFARRHLGERLTEDEMGYLMAVEEEAMLLRTN